MGNVKKPDVPDPSFSINPFVSPGNATRPVFVIGQLPNYPVVISLYQGPLPSSQCGDSNLIPLGEPISVEALQSQFIVDNLGDVLDLSRDGTYMFFANIEGGGTSKCVSLTYVLVLWVRQSIYPRGRIPVL